MRRGRRAEGEAVSDLATELECDECGDVAVEKADGIWTDGELVMYPCVRPMRQTTRVDTSRKTHAKRTGRPCRKCGGTERYGGSYSCVRCTNERSAARKGTPEYKRTAKVYWMRRRYGVTPEQVLAMLAGQGGRCGCCGAAEPGNKNGWCLDHDHATGRLRSVLCHGCNVGLGAFRDSPERLTQAAAYLKKWSE